MVLLSSTGSATRLPQVFSILDGRIRPLVSIGPAGLLGGGSRENILVWEVYSGNVTKKLPAHATLIACILWFYFERRHGLVISGCEDGTVRAWCLKSIFVDDEPSLESDMHRQDLPVTDLALCHQYHVVSASLDCTCKVFWK